MIEVRLRVLLVVEIVVCEEFVAALGGSLVQLLRRNVASLPSIWTRALLSSTEVIALLRDTESVTLATTSMAGSGAHRKELLDEADISTW